MTDSQVLTEAKKVVDAMGWSLSRAIRVVARQEIKKTGYKPKKIEPSGQVSLF